MRKFSRVSLVFWRSPNRTPPPHGIGALTRLSAETASSSLLAFSRLLCRPEVLSMRARSLLLAVICFWAGCSSPMQERVRDYNQDGVQLFQTGNYREALQSFQAAHDLAPEDAALYFNIGECYDRLAKANLAEQNYIECIQRVPD